MRAAGVLLAGLVLLAAAEGRDAKAFLSKAQSPAMKGASPDAEGLTVVRFRHETYGDQVKNAFTNALIGVFLVILGFPVLYYNEKRQLHMDKIFDYAAKVVKQNVPSDKVDSQYEANLVHTQGTTSTTETLQDDQFPVSVTNCAKMSRDVEMFQWVEEKHEESRDTPGGGKDVTTTYTYAKQWSSTRHDSSKFQEGGHDNPEMPFMGTNYQANEVALGSYQLTKSLINQMNRFVNLTGQELPDSANAGGKDFQLKGGKYVTFEGSPEIGDMRVSFKKVECKEATVVSVQHDDSFVPLTFDMVPTSKCCCFGGSVPEKVPLTEPLLGGQPKGAEINGLCSCVGAIIEAGESLDNLEEELLTASQMIERAKNTQVCIHKVLKIVGFVLFLCGWNMQFSFIPTFFRIIPFIGLWIQSFGNFFAMIGAIFFASFCWCVTIAFSWIALRPAGAAVLFGAAAAALILPSVVASQYPQA